MSREFRIKGGEKILAIIKNFGATEKVILGVLVFIALVSALSTAWAVNKNFLSPIPTQGGKLSEGVVGLPRSINPVLAFTDVDRDLSTLIYSGLMKHENGKLVEDIAKNYKISDDGLTYTFTLKDNVRFHDGTTLTTDDIEFTIQKIQDSTIKSHRRTEWVNIEIKKIGPNEIQFILKQPYPAFLSNATIGIIPKHIWSKIDSNQFIFSQYNIEPIGSGPYRLNSVKRDSGGIPIYYALSAFKNYYNGEPYIQDLHIYFYPNEKTATDARDSGSIDTIARVSASEAARIASSSANVNILHMPLPRIFGVFFNQNQAPVFARDEVRQALDIATDKTKIVDTVLFGYGVEIDSPIPFREIKMQKENIKAKEDKAKAILEKAGWVKNSDGILEKKEKKGKQTLEFSIATADAPDLKLVAEIIKSDWERLGARVTIKVFEYGDLYQNVISTRKYDALLFGESIDKDLDLYAFWHSSQRNAPGLNVAMYVNSKIDKLLEDAKNSSSEKIKKDIFDKFYDIVKEDRPAIFLYSPEFIYVTDKKVRGINLENITHTSDRFYGINKWYIKTENVWKVFGQ
ncbi:MAG TPA: ABC transporter substrate-binding protein [Candidatus Paceibacterota bacterium]